MDDNDLRLFQLFFADSRQSYRGLAEKLGLTVQAVHRRIKALEDEGILVGFTAHLSVPHLGAVPVYMSGRSQATSLDAVLESLRGDDSVEAVITSGGNMLFLRSILRGISDLEPHIEFVRKAGMLADPLPIGIEGVVQIGDRAVSRPPKRTLELSTLDYRIVNELHKDSRASVVVVAKELGVSAKTVARRLDRMLAENVIEFRAIGQLGAMQGSVGMLLIALRPGVDKAQFRKDLKDAFGLSMIEIVTLTNLTDKLFCMAWATTNAGLGELVDRVTKHGSVAGVSSHVIYKEYHFDTWRDKLVAERAARG